MADLNLVNSSREVPRLAFSTREAAKSLGCSEKHFREALLPSIQHVRSGRRVIVPVDALKQFLAEQARLDA